MHRANAAAVDALYPGCHLIMNVTGFEHRSGLIFPVHRPQPAFDSALAVPKNFGVISFHSKGPFVELFSVMTNSFQPTFTGLSSFFFKTDQKITLVDGLVPARAMQWLELGQAQLTWSAPKVWPTSLCVPPRARISPRNH